MKRKIKAGAQRKRKPVKTHELATVPSRGSFELVKRDRSGELSTRPMSARDVVAQIRLIHDIMRLVMKENVHYGTIPGCEKPSLYKAGAEKITMTFRLVPTYPEVRQVEHPNGHREFIVRSSLKTFDGVLIGEGVGSCSTLESKYKYRRADAQNTGRRVPPFFWKLRKSEPGRALQIIGGPGHSVKKFRDGWYIVIESEEKVENTSLADVWNTVLKMAKKRALIDVTIQATSASDMFTQDIEDLEENLITVELETDWKPRAQREAERNAIPKKTDIDETKTGEPVNGKEFVQPDATGDAVQTEPDEDDDIPFDDWQSVVCHVGSDAFKGKKLGMLAADQLAFLQRSFKLRRDSTDKDKKLFAVLKDSRQGAAMNKKTTATASTEKSS